MQAYGWRIHKRGKVETGRGGMDGSCSVSLGGKDSAKVVGSQLPHQAVRQDACRVDHAGRESRTPQRVALAKEGDGVLRRRDVARTDAQVALRGFKRAQLRTEALPRTCDAPAPR